MTPVRRLLFDGADRWFGLVARYTDINNYYYVTARSGGRLRAEATDASRTPGISSAGVVTLKGAVDVDNFSLLQP